VCAVERKTRIMSGYEWHVLVHWPRLMDHFGFRILHLTCSLPALDLNTRLQVQVHVLCFSCFVLTACSLYSSLNRSMVHLTGIGKPPEWNHLSIDTMQSEVTKPSKAIKEMFLQVESSAS